MMPKGVRFSEITVTDGGAQFKGVRDDGLRSGGPVKFEARFDLFMIHEAWRRGTDFEDLADGFGHGLGTNGDWSAIRDSTPEAQAKMLERALNFLFPTRTFVWGMT